MIDMSDWVKYFYSPQVSTEFNELVEDVHGRGLIEAFVEGLDVQHLLCLSDRAAELGLAFWEDFLKDPGLEWEWSVRNQDYDYVLGWPTIEERRGHLTASLVFVLGLDKFEFLVEVCGERLTSKTSWSLGVTRVEVRAKRTEKEPPT